MPATVWPCPGPAIEHGTGWPGPIIGELLEALTSPEAQVLLLPASDSRQHRHDPHPAGALAAAEDTVRAHGRRVETVFLDPPVAAATDPSRAGTLDEAPPDAGGEHARRAAPDDHDGTGRASADLVLTHLAPEAATTSLIEHLTRAAARLLTPGGVFTVLTHSDHVGGVLRDPTGPVVAAGQQADLLYLQHLVLLLAPLHHGQRTPPPETSAEYTQPRAPHRAHADAVLFTQPSTSEPEDTAPELRRGSRP